MRTTWAVKFIVLSLKHRIRFGLFLGFSTLSLLLSACNGNKAPEPVPLVIDGTVFAPAGGNVLDTLIAACYRDDCRDVRSRTIIITVSAVEANFVINGLEAAPYRIVALRDTNQNGLLDAGDYAVESSELFTPPVTLTIQLEVVF